jgi:hypothetical protein
VILLISASQVDRITGLSHQYPAMFSCKRCPSIDEWIKKMWYIYMVEYYSAIKKNEIILFSGNWMKLEILCYVK